MAKKTSPVGEAVKKAVGKKDSKSHAADMSREMKIQSALYEIADAASAVTDMQEFYAAMHRIVGRLMYAKSFYVTLYDATTGILSSPYFADESGDTPPPPTKIDKSNKSLRGYVLLKGRTLHICAAEIEEGKRRGKFKPMGTMAEDWVGVPLRMEGQTIGSLTVQSYQKGIRYTEQDVKLLEFVAQHIAVALTRARAIEETRQRNSELQIVNSVQEGLASKLDMQAIYELVGDKIRRIFDADVVGIVFYDRELGMMNYPYLIDHGERYFPEPAPISDKHMNYVKATGAVLIHTYEQASQLMSKWGIKNVGGPMPDNSYIAVPLFISNQIMGRITVAKLPSHAFNESDVRLLQTLANSMSVALENARLFDETQRLFRAEQQAHQQAEILRSIAQALNHSLSLTDVFDLVLTEIQNVIPYDSAGIYQVHGNRREFVTGRGFTNLDDLMGVSFEFNQRDDEIGYLISQSLQPLILGDASVEYPQYFNTGLHAATKIRSYMAVPIVLNQKLIGMITLDKLEPNFYSDQHAKLAMAFAAQAATAINNARLFDETQRLLKETEDRAAELAIINRVQEGLATKLEIQAIYELVGDKIREIFDANTVVLATFDFEKGLMHRRYTIERGMRYYFDPTPIPRIWVEFIQQGQPALINENLLEFMQRIDPDFDVPAGEMPKSALSVPLRLQGEIRGVISLQNVEREHAFSESDMRLLQTFANSMSVALENARLFDETQQRNAELAIINSVQEGLVSKLDMQAIYDLVGEKIRETFNAQVVSIVTYDRAEQLMHSRYYYEDGRALPGITLPSFGFRKYVLENCRPLLINEDMPRWIKEYNNPVMRGTEPKSAIFIPMIVGEEATGVISLQNNDRELAFTEADVRLLTTLANSMSVALENARLWEQEKMYRKALERELEIGREIQAGFLPDELPLIEGWEIGASLMSAREVAGDFYDAFELPDGNIGLVIADVCDKGVGAALFMTLFRSLIRVTANQEMFEHAGHDRFSNSVAQRLQHAMLLTNNYIAETHEASGMFATLFFGILDPRDGSLTYINGGHEPPLILEAGGVCESLRKTGPAVGAIPDCSFDTLETRLNPGAMFFAFTDGVPEAKDPIGDFFGRERLLNILRADSGSAHELLKTVESELHHYMNGATQFDDITLLAVRRVR